MLRFECHAHTDTSNIRLLDSINQVNALINKALNIGLAGISITDHEVLSNCPEASFIAEEIQKQNPDFKVALGNEIYLCDTREMGQKYYHLILLSKNLMGWRALRELSSRAWMNSYWDRGMERVVTLKSDLEEIVNKFSGGGYGDLKKALAEVLVEKLTGIQDKYNKIMQSGIIDDALDAGRDYTNAIAKEKYERIRKAVGYGR